jgi:hypothetical protein
VVPEIIRALLEVELDTVVPLELKKTHTYSYIRNTKLYPFIYYSIIGDPLKYWMV